MLKLKVIPPSAHLYGLRRRIFLAHLVAKQALSLLEESLRTVTELESAIEPPPAPPPPAKCGTPYTYNDNWSREILDTINESKS